MPASRSRTQHWRRCLEQIYERNGSLEIAIARPEDDASESNDLVWRVRLLALESDRLAVEMPTALGRPIELGSGVDLVAFMTIGQNRWMFRTRIECIKHRNGRAGLVLAMPETVRRCQRRREDRMRTRELNLVTVDMWPLLDPKSVVLAERANELDYATNECGRREMAIDPEGTAGHDEHLLPEVGPCFAAQLMNLGGGGLGLSVPPNDAPVLGRHRLFWVRFALPPELQTPICATAKLVHTHIDSSQNTYAGVAFDFTFNPGHQEFVVEQIRRFIGRQVETQRLRRSA